MTDPSNLPLGATSHIWAVAALQPRLPTFWRENLQVWFAQVEAIFDLHLITSETSRFRHLHCNPSLEVAEELAEVIAAPLSDAPARRQHLPTSEDLGDRHPSQLLLGASNVDWNGVLAFRSPPALFLAATEDWTLDCLAQLADRVHDAISHAVTALSSTPQSSIMARLEPRID
ncbi:hypothetical protein HPB49_010489 [Dermacentor silvarum]|uniref:Uncharacterized protein n=1 Tax=Dermacentor silvarum TaxID=543639 RepID=A0ACB8CER2_DERSI|nr:hypothetical protein HPB49_010489 [Dermacentor silvarum]